MVRQGMLEAKGEYRLFIDADNSTSVAKQKRCGLGLKKILM